MAEDTATLVVVEPGEEIVILYQVMMPLGMRGGVHSSVTWLRETGDPLSEATGPGAETQEGK